MAHWLLKSEPETFSWDDQTLAGIEPWDGVRNHQAAKNLRAMRTGDLAFFYHSGKERAVVGVVEVVREAYADPTDETGRFVMVDVATREAFPTPVTLARIKAEPACAGMALVRLSRLSVSPVTEAEWRVIRRMGGFPT